jgi:hypothetical protein
MLSLQSQPVKLAIRAACGGAYVGIMVPSSVLDS